jgi:hypothetical protein
MDALYIKGMLKNPDIQPNATINQWVATIKLFDFELVHVPASKHMAPNGLSRQEPMKEDRQESKELTNDLEDWVNRVNCFATLKLQTQADVYQYPEARGQIWQLTKDGGVTEAPNKDGDYAIHGTPKQEAANNKVMEVHQWLGYAQKPVGMRGKLLKRFLKYAERFLWHNKQLWCKAQDGRHKLYVPKPNQYRLIRNAHNGLGHKGQYSIGMNLCKRFWWPGLEEDVKWFIETCNECQCRRTHHIAIPPIVPFHGGLFRKVHIDTMLMPKS